MRTLFINVKQTCDDEQLSEPGDRHVEGINAVEVEDSLSDAKAASSALDTFHGKTAIGMLDDFEISVYDGTEQIEEDPDHEGYTLVGPGDVWFIGPLSLKIRLFSGIYPCGIVYADRDYEVSGVVSIILCTFSLVVTPVTTLADEKAAS